MTGVYDGLQSAQGKRLSHIVYDVIKDRLLEGEWRSGESLGVELLKRELGVSKQPIMEALRRLDGDGLVEIIPQVGCRVPSYSTDEVSDFFSLFASLESEATAIATRRRTDGQLDELERVNRRIEVVMTLDDSNERARQYRQLNRNFHSIILAMAHSPVVQRTSNRMWDMSDLLINVAAANRPLSDEVCDRHADHVRIIAALRERNAAIASAEMSSHILRNIDMLEKARSA